MPTRSPASEQEFLRLVDRHFPLAHPHTPLSRGDDCARLACSGNLVLSTDLFLEDVHFRRSYFPAEAIGHKALAVNVSDIAAMGCRPLGFSLGLMVPPGGAGQDETFWDGLFAGMAALAREHGLALTGGDLSKAPMLGLCLTIWGEPGPTGRVLTRTARPGDALLAVGGLGQARAGLQALEGIGPAAARRLPRCAAAHLRPRPRVAEGLRLAEAGATGCMDVSDGLAQDLPRLLGPGLGARLEIAEQALDPEIPVWCAETGQDPARFAYLGGEDYALLAAAPPEAADALASALPETLVIGAVTDRPGLILNNEPAPDAGFDHFRAKEKQP
ncbi:thiamine-phosphate kinase [Desulfocurvus sp. DL9XJH121]